jgi:putative peptidoglycan lipid II flippase
VFVLQVLAASALLAVYLMWAAGSVAWIQLGSQGLWRVGLMAAVLLGATVLYFGALVASGLKLKAMLKA